MTTIMDQNATGPSMSWSQPSLKMLGQCCHALGQAAGERDNVKRVAQHVLLKEAQKGCDHRIGLFGSPAYDGSAWLLGSQAICRKHFAKAHTRIRPLSELPKVLLSARS